MLKELSPSTGRLNQIVRAAQTCLARDGYANVSIKDIAQEAGVAPGLVHYYFESKEDLLIAAVRQVAETYCHEFFSQLEDASNPGQGLTNSIEWAGRKFREDPAWFLLLLELYSLSLHDPKVRSELIEMLREERALVTKVVSAILPASPETLGVSAEQLGTLILAIFDGIVIHALIDPEVDPVQSLSAIARAITALVSTGVTRPINVEES